MATESLCASVAVGVAASDAESAVALSFAAGAELSDAAAGWAWMCSLRRLSVWARSAGSCACASSALPEHPPTVMVAASRANPSRALRATGLSLRTGRLDEGADLELCLEQRTAGVTKRL